MGRKHVYGIVQADRGTRPGALGVGGSPIYTLAYQGLACVLSDYAGDDFANMPKEELVRHLLVYQAVIEQVIEEDTVLPVKFGTLLAGEGEVLELLSQGHSRLADALARVDGRIEVEVAATWDINQVLAEIAHEPEIAQAREAVRKALATLPAGDVLQQRVRLGQMVKEALDQRREAHRQRMMDFLRPLALDMQPNALISDQMVMNVAFLVDRAREKEFVCHLEQLSDLFHDQINFRIVGPLPPYSFSTVEVSRPDWDEIEAAKQALGLGDVISESEVRQAYRSLAGRSHPDLNPGDGAAKDRFTRLRSASATLLGYCRGRAIPLRGSPGPGGLGIKGLADSTDAEARHPVTRDSVQRTLLLTIGRSAGQEAEAFCPSRPVRRQAQAGRA